MKVDLDKSGFLSFIEFEDVMKLLTSTLGSEDCTTQDLHYLIERLDENGDGTVSKQEFQRLVNIVVKMVFPQPNPKSKKGMVEA